MAGLAAHAAIRRTRLDSGARIVTEAMPMLRSVAIGFWVGTGSRDEPEELAGASHFLEHLLFKGTDSRTAAEIADAVESVGGDMNAFTTQELTAFYVRVPDECLDLAIEILSDIVWEPALRLEDVDAERQVILEEIRMRDDAPEDLVHDVFADAMFPGHPIGREVIGSPDTIDAMGPDEISAFHQRHYHPSNVVVAVAGNLGHDHVVERVEQGIGGANGSRPPRDMYAGEPAPRRLAVLERPTEQAHIVVGMRSLARADEDRYALTVLNQTLGGGMSSRLFQEVRERRGLAYSVYSFRAAFEETGAFAVSAGTSPERLPELLSVIDAELERVVADGGISAREMDAAKGHLRGSLALSLESSASRMHRLGRSELTMGEIPSLDEVVAEVDAVQADDVARVVDRVLATDERTLAVVGPVEEQELLARA
ncbi:MAG: insulinase family protein [Actinobacteria bacterium]|nr:insulinase family protein [Actinomycetota bacterium]